MTAIDALHAGDPERAVVDGESVPAELLYARRMSAALEQRCPDASDALRLAARAQHLCRFRTPRSHYPEGRAGYLRWRTEQAKAHAALAAETLREAGYDDADIARVESLIRKKRLAADPEAQALEDTACLVFLESYLPDFARGRERAQVVDILQKTWRKMSERGRELALGLELMAEARALVEEALAG